MSFYLLLRESNQIERELGAKPSAIISHLYVLYVREAYRCWITTDLQYDRIIYGILYVDFLIRSWMNIYSIPHFHTWFWRAIQTQSKRHFDDLVFKIFICLKYCLYLHNSSTIWVAREKKTKERVHHHWNLAIIVCYRF